MDPNEKQFLLISGALLLLLGLLNGVAVPYLNNTRMGLSAHLAGAQNALVLLAVGAGWRRVALPQWMRAVARWLLVISMYGFWIGLLLAAIWGTSRATPIAGAGFETVAWKEDVVEITLRSASAVSILAVLLLLIGFWRGRQRYRAAHPT